MHGQAARNTDRLTGDEGGIVAGEECHEARIVSRFADSAQRYASHHRIAYLLALFAGVDEGVHGRGIRWTRADAIQQHVVTRHLARERLRKRDRCSLTAGVHHFSRRADASGVRGYEDYAAAIALDHASDD